MRSETKILITGATSGIGEATARLLAREWPKPLTLILTGRRKERLDKLAAELSADSVKASGFVLDVRSSSGVQNFVNANGALLEGLDILVNNAGLAAGLSRIQDGDLEDWETMIDTNIKGILYMTRALLPAMVKARKGHIVNIGSIAGREVYPNGNVYCATKHAVRALNEAMRIDTVGSKVRVTSIDPGMVETEFSLVRFKGDREKARAVYAGMRALTPEDIAEAILWSLSRPAHVNIQEILIMPTDQAGPRDVHRE